MGSWFNKSRSGPEVEPGSYRGPRDQELEGVPESIPWDDSDHYEGFKIVRWWHDKDRPELGWWVQVEVIDLTSFWGKYKKWMPYQAVDAPPSKKRKE